MGNSENKKKKVLITVIFMLLVISVILAMLCGSVRIDIREFGKLFSEEPLSRAGYILKYIRIPRVIAAIFAGMGLAVAGVIIQLILNNPLASPNIIGVNSGAGFMVVLCGVLLPNMYRLLPLAAFFGAFFAAALVYFVAKKTKSSKSYLVLAGVAINSLFNGATDFVYTLSDDVLISSRIFKIGGLNGVNTQVLVVAAIAILLCFITASAMHNELEVLSLGEETASSLGLNVGLYRFIFLAIAAVLAGSSISFAGLIGFVGLIVPHIARMLVGSQASYLITASAMLGALLVVLCDLVARTLFQPHEIPVGVILSFLGAPFFIWLLTSRKKRRPQ